MKSRAPDRSVSTPGDPQAARAGTPFVSTLNTSLHGCVALTVQCLFLVRSRSEWRTPWWRLAASYAVLMLLVNRAVWDGYPGAITRIVLPLTAGFNVLLVRGRPTSFWPWWVAGNLHLVPALHTMPFPFISGAP